MREANPNKKSRKIASPVQFLTLEQARQFLGAAKGDPLEALYILALTTGMRWGDLLTLKWEALDLAYREQEVSENIPQRRQGRLQITEEKTKIGRCIMLTTLALEALTHHRLRQDEQRLAAGESWQDHGLVFCNVLGNPLGASSIRHHSFAALRERASLAFIRFHDLRPSAVHLLLLAGAPPKVVQEMFGYRSGGMAIEVNISPSVLLSLQEEAIQRLNALLWDEQKAASPVRVNADKNTGAWSTHSLGCGQS